MIALLVIAWHWPATETISGPRRAVLKTTVPGLELGVSAHWYDRGLNRRALVKNLVFAEDGGAALPVYRIPTQAGRLALKRLLEPRHLWTECENCYGPAAYATLYRRNDYTPPDKTRLAQNSVRNGDEVEFTVSLLPDETQYTERPWTVDDPEELLAEVRAILASDVDTPNVDPRTYGPALRRLDPVRAERQKNTLIVWMGGAVGYSLHPDSAGGPFINGAFMSGTDDPRIQKIENFLFNASP